LIIEGIDHYRVMEPLFEGIRVMLSYRGERYSPEYVQGISGAAFRIAGICPCAPTCSSAMAPQDLVRVFGYEVVHIPLSGEGVDPKQRIHEVIKRVKDEIRSGRPVLIWHAFTNAEWDVVCGFDDVDKQFFGRGSYAGLVVYARAHQMRMIECLNISPAMGAIFIGEKKSEFKSTEAELAALKEAVHHAHTPKVEKPNSREWVFLEGLPAYDRWASDFKDPQKLREAGDSYCHSIYRSTHRAAGGFMREIASKYVNTFAHFNRAALCFATEVDALDRGEDLLGWDSPEGPDPERNKQAAELLREARGWYARAIDEIEAGLAVI